MKNQKAETIFISQNNTLYENYVAIMITNKMNI